MGIENGAGLQKDVCEMSRKMEDELVWEKGRVAERCM